MDITTSGWQLPPVFKWLRDVSQLNQDEMLRTFNCGIGIVLVVEKGETVEVVLRMLGEGGECENAMVLGTLVDRVADEAQVEIVGNIQ